MNSVGSFELLPAAAQYLKEYTNAFHKALQEICE